MVPSPSIVSNHILPLACSTMVLLIANPKPVPEDLVVKLGIKIFDFISSGIPSPLSDTFTKIVSPFNSSLTLITRFSLSWQASNAFWSKLVNNRLS